MKPALAVAADVSQVDATVLDYVEREPGIDEYQVVYTVSERYVRIDDRSDGNGFIVYDDEEETIYSVSGHDRSVLVISSQPFSVEDSPAAVEVEYLELADAPTVDDKKIYNYRVHPAGQEDATCTELQLVEGLLPDVTPVLKRFQQVLTGHQVTLTDNVMDEMRGHCYYIDQVYNDGAYYDKGMPIQEWHSNERSRLLTGYRQEKVSKDLFDVPDGYRRFSITSDSRTPL